MRMTVVVKSDKDFGAMTRQYTSDLMAQVKKNVTAATKTLYGGIRDNVSLKDHSLKDLAKMGHPYSKRRFQAIHAPYWKVHIQSGNLLSAVKTGTTLKGQSFTGYVGIDEAIAPHAKAVVYGTQRMVARDFLTGTLKQLEDKIISSLRENLPKHTFSKNYSILK